MNYWNNNKIKEITVDHLRLSSGRIIRISDIADSYFDSHLYKHISIADKICCEYGLILKDSSKVVIYQCNKLPLINNKAIKHFSEFLDSIVNLNTALGTFINICNEFYELKELANTLKNRLAAR